MEEVVASCRHRLDSSSPQRLATVLQAETERTESICTCTFRSSALGCVTPSLRSPEFLFQTQRTQLLWKEKNPVRKPKRSGEEMPIVVGARKRQEKPSRSATAVRPSVCPPPPVSA